MFYNNKYTNIMLVVVLFCLLNCAPNVLATSPPPSSSSSTERLAADVVDTLKAAVAAEKVKIVDVAADDGGGAAGTPANAATGTAPTAGQQIPLVRLPSNTLLKYTAYKDVSILHFRIPSDTRTALFSFKAYEESKSAFRK